MCHRNELCCVGLFALGAGLILSCLFGGWLLRLVIGIILIFIGLLLTHR